MLAEALSQILALFLNPEKMLKKLTFHCAVVLSLSFTDFAFLTGEIVKLHIVIGAKSKTKRYNIHKV